MGSSISSLLPCRRIPKLRLLIFGLDAAGKTSLLYRAKTGDLITTIPTIGFNVETVHLEGLAKLTVWDVGGRDKIRPLYRHYFANTQGFLFIIDSCDYERLPEALELLRWIDDSLDTEGLSNIPVAVLCNKCDFGVEKTGRTVEEVRRLLSDDAELQRRLPGLRGRPRACFEVSAVTGQGLLEALEWTVAAALGRPSDCPAQTGTELLVADRGVAAKSAAAWSGLYGLVKSALLR